LSNIDTKELKDNLMSLISEDRIYLNKDITLKSLSNELSITTHQLSEYLNKERKESFNDFVNSFRIQYAQELLMKSETSIYTLEGVSSESGFKSLATFHRNFKKHTGTSPLKWLDKEKSI
jgi:YesN/AraC family two-component response regulator